MSTFKCPKCFATLHNKFELESHVPTCKGGSISMDIIAKLAEGGLEALHSAAPAELSFKCFICGGNKVVTSLAEYDVRAIKGICDNCINDLKDIILTKRKKNGKV